MCQPLPGGVSRPEAGCGPFFVACPGAGYVHFPPQPRELLAEVAAGLMGQPRMLPLPLLDETRCTRCGDCVPAFPAHCLAMAGPFPRLPLPLDCVHCALVCPAAAPRVMLTE